MPEQTPCGLAQAATAIAMLPIVLAPVGERWHVRVPVCEAQARFVVGFADHAAPAALSATPSEPPRQGPKSSTLLPLPS